MANIKSAEKRARQAIVRKDRNHQAKKAVRTTEKKLREIIAGGKKEEMTTLFKKFESMMSKAAQKGIYHKNKASRKIGRIAALISK